MGGKSSKIVKKGSTGEDVRVVQRALNYRLLGSRRLKTDGVFGKHTEYSLLSLQDRTGARMNGIVDDQTLFALFPLATVTTTISLMRLRYPSIGAPNTQPAHRPLIPPLTAPSLLTPPSVPAPQGQPWTLETPNAHLQHWLLEPLRAPQLPTTEPLPAPRLPDLGRFKFDSVQSQTGTAINVPPLEASGSSVIVLQSVWARKMRRDYQQQFTAGLQVQGPLTIPSDDGKNWTITAFTQFTWADPFWRFGRYHLAQPFAQLAGQYDVAKRAMGFSAGLFPVNVSVDLVGDGDISIFAQGGVVGNLTQKSDSGWKFTGGPQFGFGLTVKIPQTSYF